MARKLRLQYEGAIYHITVRGNGRKAIFLEDSNRERLIWRLAESCELYEVRLYLYCLLDNHFHLLVETPRGNISRFMQSVLTGYTVYFNLKYDLVGHVVQGRYGAQLVEGDSYLLRLSRYIHLNPVHTREAEDWDVKQKRQWLRAYPWSSYRGYIDERRKGELVNHAPLLGLVADKHENPRMEYRRYVETGLASDDNEFVELLADRPRAIGSREFRKWADDEYAKLKDAQGSGEDVSFRREAVLKDVDGIVRIVAKAFKVEMEDMTRTMRGSIARPVAARMLVKYAGLSQRAAGRELGYRTGSAVCHQLSFLAERMQGDPKLRRKLVRIERNIGKLE
ncbi:transposase [Verrucomicrobiota bacterium]